MRNKTVKYQFLIRVMCLLFAFFAAGGFGKMQAFAADAENETDLDTDVAELTSGETDADAVELTSGETDTDAVGRGDVSADAIADDDPEAYLAWADSDEYVSTVSDQSISSRAELQDLLTAAATDSDDDDDEEELEVKAYGIDVSKYQGEIDWEQVKESGVSFAIIRVGYRGYSAGNIVQDTYAIENIEGALAAGIEVGVYFFSTALNQQEAIEEAQFVLSAIEGYDITYPVVYDCEGYNNSSYRNYGLGSETRTENAIAFLNYVEAAGYQGMMYGSVNALKEDTNWVTSTLEQYYDMWVAQYYYYTTSKQYPGFSALADSGRMTSYPSVYRIWQFSSQGKIDGISGSVDLDIEYVTENYIMDTDVIEYVDESNTNALLVEYTTGWVKDSEENIYYYDNGVMQTGFLEVDGDTYYFAESGIMQTGLCKIDGKIYYFTYKGAMWTGWLTFNDGTSETATYYFGSDGAALTGEWATIDGEKYYFNPSGRLHYGWRTIDGEKYYCDPDTGVMQTGWMLINGKKYYFNPSGRLHYGWRTIDGEKYYCDPDTGVMQTGWMLINGKKYYFNVSGRLHYGWRTLDGEKYYADPDTGVIQTSTWVTISGKRYYFNLSGRLHYGWRTIDGEKYYCDPNTGALQTGWMTIDGEKYYADPDTGVIQTNTWLTIDGAKYFFNPSGRLHYGWRTIDGEKYYCDPETGVMQTGWVTIDGKLYYFYEDGRLEQ